MIKAIFFDVHEVITHGEFDEIERRFSERTRVPLQVVTDYYRKNLEGCLIGEVTPTHMHTAFGLESEMDVEEMMTVWQEEIVEVMTIDSQMIALLKNLRRDYQIVCLTNLSEQRHRADIEMGLYDNFDHLVLSLKEGVKKPNLSIFQRALEISGTVPEESIFVDDQVKNVEAAEELGIKSIHFKGYDELVKNLANLGVNL